jgi:Uma2 family endonuclease
MTVLIHDPQLETRLKRQREASGADRLDEVWEGVYTMTPMPNDEHQRIVMGISGVFLVTIGWTGLGEVRAGVNLSDRGEDWAGDYRIPDVAVFLHDGRAKNHGTHWSGGDLLVEITSPDDRTREKIPFYARLGVEELLILDREPWSLELYRLENRQFVLAGTSRPESGDILASARVPLRFQLVPGDSRPKLNVSHHDGRSWLV